MVRFLGSQESFANLERSKMCSNCQFQEIVAVPHFVKRLDRASHSYIHFRTSRISWQKNISNFIFPLAWPSTQNVQFRGNKPIQDGVYQQDGNGNRLGTCMQQVGLFQIQAEGSGRLKKGASGLKRAFIISRLYCSRACHGILTWR